MKKDRRYEKTEEKIREAFFELLKKSTLQEVTVKEIISEAGINRATFYLHYQDKYALQEKIEQEMFSEIFEIISDKEQSAKGTCEEDGVATLMIPPSLEQIRRLTEFAEKNRNKMQLMADIDVAEHFVNEYFMHNKEWIDSQFSIFERDPVTAHYLKNAIKGMIIGMLGTWFRRGFQESAEEFFETYGKVVLKLREGISRMLAGIN